ncbi:MAG: hypothetical protein F4Y49_10200 [Dehalococcoidia bacterium]|nr:hypothetical protein [Dehalococcoidia bacterium]
MQNRYVGDVGDFGKYGLLRYLTGQREAPSTSSMPMCLGVVWYLYPDESHNADGKYTGYLDDTHANHSRYRVCDLDLYDTMRRLVKTGRRNILAVQRNRILPVDTAYYEPSLSFPRQMPRSERESARTRWFEGALEATADADVIFVDPDNSLSDPANGISASIDPLRKTGPKYVFIADLLRFFERGQSLIVYHHLGRRGTAVEQIARVAESLKASLDLPGLPRSLLYRRGSSRAYFIVPQERHRPTLETRVSDLLRSPWNSHFELVV